MNITPDHINKVIKIYASYFKKWPDTHWGAKGISNAVLGYPDRNFGDKLKQLLIDMEIIEFSRRAPNTFQEGVASIGHDPNIDTHQEFSTYYRKGPNWANWLNPS